MYPSVSVPHVGDGLQEGLRDGVRFGETFASGPLALVSVFGGVAAPNYALAAYATAAGTLLMGETGGERSRSRRGHAGDLPVLLVEGEHLEGAMQDRVLNFAVLVPPQIRDADPGFA